MEIIKTNIEGLLILKPDVYGDERGYFFESWRETWLKDLNVDTQFIQDNQSASRYGVIRGLHYQLPPYQQAKLVRVLQGKVLDVAVDIRKNSPTYGQHHAINITPLSYLMKTNYNFLSRMALLTDLLYFLISLCLLINAMNIIIRKLRLVLCGMTLT